MQKLFILLSLVSFQMLAGEADIKIPRSLCEDVDIRDQNPSLREFFSTPRSQDSIGWCYGFSAADLLSAELARPVSAAHTSALYNKDVQSNFFWRLAYKFAPGSFDEVYEGGFVKKALKSVRNNQRVCLEDDFPYDANMNGEFYYLVRNLESLKERIENEQVNDENKCLAIRRFINSEDNINLNANELYAALMSENLNIVLEQIASSRCGENQISVPEMDFASKSMPSLNRFSNESAEDATRRHVRSLTRFFGTIDEKLKSGKPLSVDYNVKHITHDDGLHASVLVARRWHNGRCEFKIRNSWGVGCSMYDRSEITECNSSEGSYWVTDQKFYEMVNNITYID